MRIIFLAGLFFVGSLLGACQANSIATPAPQTSNAASQDHFDDGLSEALKTNSWYMQIPKPERALLRQCLVKQAAKDATAKFPISEDAWTKEANVRMAVYINQIGQGIRHPFEQTCPDVLEKLDHYLPES